MFYTGNAFIIIGILSFALIKSNQNHLDQEILVNTINNNDLEDPFPIQGSIPNPNVDIVQ